MKMYYLKMLLFTFLINTLVLPHYENFQNKHYNKILIQNNTKRTTIKSRLLAQTQKHNPHYHNDPELKEIIDKMNEEAIKKYQQTHDPYEQLKDVVEKNGTKYTGGHGAEPLSTIEKELLETYVETFGNKNHVMLKSGRYPNDDDESVDSSSCECIDINNAKIAKTKGRDKYLKHLKGRCTRGIYFCSVGSALLTTIGVYATKAVLIYKLEETSKNCSVTCVSDLAGTAAGVATGIFYPCGIAALVLLILAVVLIILYIWLYRRRKKFMET
ncbi:stevor isoform troph beta [Plasmodium falciparum Dd2]|uniref:Stevor isoform troph beta n=1 Tax=Plasmodium falciparum (isolate Dd2) TaxID=57267 RepID=A0A0L7LX12_PLAF4|nr:stevor isoform troph beta [Plasmodium falciparum Dd2]